MQRDFNRKLLAARQTEEPHTKWPWALSILCIVVILCLVGFAISKYKKHSLPVISSSNYLSEIKNWLPGTKKIVQDSSPPKIKTQLVQTTSAPIKFVFYSALTNMQIPTGAEDTNVYSKTFNQASSKITTIATATKAKSNSLAIVTAEDLERELSAHIKADAHQYVLQLGVFSTYTAAKKYKNQLNKQGFSTQIINLSSAKKHLFRVQLGPFINAQQAFSAKKELLKTGFSGILRKS